jgi:5-methyltetrahydrofolate--homocysteine methyltransferase
LKTEITSPSKKIVIQRGNPTVLIGERINPTGRKKFAQALLEGNLDMVAEDAVAQVKAGADMLDVNVGAAGVDEVDLLPKAVQKVMEVTDVPLCIDSSKRDALEAALEVYSGKALINSVTGEKASMEKILPLVKKYDCAVVALCMDDNGIPKEPEGRLEVAKKIVKNAEELGIPRENIVVDCLTMTVSSDQKAALTTLKAMELVVQELGVNLVLGASNVSFGLPERETVNAAFMSMAIKAGMTSVIMNPNAPGIRRIIRAADLLMGADEFALNYINDCREFES